MAIDQLSLTATRYEVGVFPTLFVIDCAGVIRARLAGRRPGQITASVERVAPRPAMNNALRTDN